MLNEMYCGRVLSRLCIITSTKVGYDIWYALFKFSLFLTEGVALTLADFLLSGSADFVT